MQKLIQKSYWFCKRSCALMTQSIITLDYNHLKELNPACLLNRRNSTEVMKTTLLNKWGRICLYLQVYFSKIDRFTLCLQFSYILFFKLNKWKKYSFWNCFYIKKEQNSIRWGWRREIWMCLTIKQLPLTFPNKNKLGLIQRSIYN